jgi:hypothetical protein
MMDLQIWNQRREELMHEAQQDRLAKALRESLPQAARWGTGLVPGVGDEEGRGPSAQAPEVFKASRMKLRRKPGE